MIVLIDYLLILLVSFIPFRDLSKFLSILLPAISIPVVILSGNFEATLLGKHGVHLVLDNGSKYFLILVSVVYTGVAIYRFEERWRYIDQFLFLSSFATLSLTYTSGDLFNLYVMMEVLSIQAGLLVLKDTTGKTLWSALKYLILGNIGANLYLIGVEMIYSSNGTFKVSDVVSVSSVAVSLMTIGLLVRGGAFFFGMWLPPFHSSAPSSFSALHSTVFVESTIYAFYRLSTNPVFYEKLTILKVIAPFLVIGGALLTLPKVKFKDVLAASTMSHLGLMAGNPLSAPLYALAHGISKAPLFLMTGRESIGRLEKFFIHFFIASLIGTPFTFEEFVEHELVKDLPFLKFSALVAGGILGYSLLTRISFKNGKSKVFSLYFGSIALILTLTHFEGFHPSALIPPAVALFMITFLRRRRILDFLETMERMDVNLALIIFTLGVIVWLGFSL